VPLPTVYLDGIVKIGDNVRVLFSIPPDQDRHETTYSSLALGEQDGELELVRILPDQQGVDVLVDGTLETLTAQSNSPVASAIGRAGAPPPPPAPASAPSGGSAIIAGGGGGGDGGNNRGSSPYGGVAVAGGGGGDGGSAGGSSVAVGGGFNSGSSGSGVAVSGGATPGAPTSAMGQIANTLLSGGNSGTQNQAAVANNAPAAPIIPPEQQDLTMAAQYIKGQQEGNPLPPLPPSIVDEINGVPEPPSPGLPALPR
jgi:hypothetical protein